MNLLATNLRSRLRRRLRDESGQSLVEFAMMLPLLLLVVLALVDFGRALNLWLDATHVANEGARLAAVNTTPPSGTLAGYIQEQAFGELRDGSGSSSGVQGPAKVCISFPDGSLRGDPVKVTVTASYDWVPGGLIPGSFAIAGSSTMRLEQDASFAAGCSS